MAVAPNVVSVPSFVPKGGVGSSPQEMTEKGKTQKSLKGLHVPFGLGAPWDTPKRAEGCLVSFCNGHDIWPSKLWHKSEKSIENSKCANFCFVKDTQHCLWLEYNRPQEKRHWILNRTEWSGLFIFLCSFLSKQLEMLFWFSAQMLLP